MDALLKQEFEVPCPGGGRSTKMRLDRILNSSSVRTSKGEYKLKSNSKSKIKNQLRNMQREQDRFQKQLEKMQREFFELYAQMLQDAEKVIK
jgi:signal transduction protein with GAF and PtsI domain